MSINYRVKQRLQAALKQQSHGLLSLTRLFKSFDTDHSGALSWEEFCAALQKCGLAPSPQDIRSIFLDLDKDGNNEISYTEFIQVMRGELSNQRKALIKHIFESIDTDRDGQISMTDIGKCFNPKNHPDVRAGRITAATLLKEFFDLLSIFTDTGYLNLSQFMEYYASSAAFDDDIKFAEVMKGLWTTAGTSSSTPSLQRPTTTTSSAYFQSTVGGLLTDVDPGLNNNLERLREQLKARGARGFVGLQRKFRIMDDDGSRTLNLVEFKKALRESGVTFTELQMSQLFTAFDRDRNGAVDFDEFLVTARGPMNARRRKLIHLAFGVLDRNGSGEVDVEDIVNVYNASKHPDVISGKRTEDEVLREFLDTFDVGGVKDGKVTKEEFENYYNNISASIDDDDYFELMIRNAWHISGGQGWAANSANKRVLVAHADGRETVEEIKNDLGLKSGDREGMLSRLRQEGVSSASSVSAYGGYDNTAGKATRNQSESLTDKMAKLKVSSVDDLDENSLRIAKLGPSSGAAGHGTEIILANLGTVQKRSSSVPSMGLIHIIQKVKYQLRAFGATSFIGLQRKFRIMDDDGNNRLDLNEFKKAMKELGMSLSEQEMRMVFEYFDTNRDNTIDFEEFIQGVRDPLNERRKRLVQLAFSKLDRDGSGIVDAAEVASMYDASKHPEVLAGRLTEREALQAFLDTFDVGGVKDGMVTQEEFINYYTNLGANIDNDDYFELMIRNAWHISGGQGWSANSANKRVLVTHADGRETVEEIKNDLGLKSGDREGMLSRLRQEGVSSASSVSAYGAAGDSSETIPHVARLQDVLNRKSGGVSSQNSMPPPPPPSVNIRSSYDNSFAPVPPRVNQIEALSPSKLPAAVAYLVGKLKEEMRARGAHGFVGMQRKFRIIDDDNSKSLSYPEFKKAMKELNMQLSDSEMRTLFDYFDTNHNGSIDFEEFIQGVRDPLNDRRLQLVKLAFNKLDIDGNGIVDAAEIARTYDASKHPDVLSGRRTEQQVLTEFLDTFDVGGVKDGMVTQEEFINYYTNLGANIDNDDYFELMIRNAWHISGGQGWSANSANKRVLVTHADGRETVEEIKNDLGLKSGDREGMLSRLRQEGVSSASSVSAYGVADDPRKGITGAKRRSALNHFRGTIPAGVLPGTGLPQRSQPSSAVKSRKEEILLRKMPADIRLLVDQFKTQIRAKGGLGFISLQRKFRIMDDDNSKTISMTEFKKAMKELNISLSEADQRSLFEYFDTDNSGDIDFEEFIQGVRDPLSPRRLELVKQAFQILDVDGNGIVDAAEIASKYDASKHPEVLAGRLGAEQVLNQFLDTFDVGGVKDGMVTQEEFINYYTNLGANIDNDDYFELMIRNAWHISGGQGWSANSANKRVLVTHADGRETVEEIKNDLGLKSGDREGMLSRLRQEGVSSASSVSAYGVAGDDKLKFGEKPYKAQDSISLGQLSKSYRANPSTSPYIPVDRRNQQLESGGLKSMNKKPRQPAPPATYGVKVLLDKLKAELKARGANGFIGLQRKFKIMDDNNDRQINLPEFKKAIKEMNIQIPENDLRAMFSHFDTDNSGDIDFEEFIQGVRDPLSPRRLELVKQAFQILDVDDNGIVDAAEIASKYDASKHPEVLAGRLSAEQVLNQFLDTFDVGGVKDGMVTQEEFINYYTNLGANIDNDDYFELMIRNAWHISGGQGWSANSANKRVLVTHADGRETVEEIKNDLGISASNRPAMISKLKAQGSNASSIALFGGGEYGYESARRPQTAPESCISGSRKKGVEEARSSVYRSSIVLGDDVSSNPHRKKPATYKTGVSLSNVASGNIRQKPLDEILSSLRSELARRGARGIVGLQRKFRIIDDNGDGSLSLGEFTKAMIECDLRLSEEEILQLFRHFDMNGDGNLDFEEFLVGVRGPMNNRRKQLVKMAFAVLDKSGNGVIEPDDIIDKYDATKHPDVLTGRRTPDDIFREFLDTFDVGGVKDGKVTKEEFENYYNNISASIDDDDYFELMIRNAWHISGGQGWSANSANKRVLVTHADGRETVEEIKNDLGLKSGDREGMLSRLRQEGVSSASSVSAYGGYDNTAGLPSSRARGFGQRNVGFAGSSSASPTANRIFGQGGDDSARPSRKTFLVSTQISIG